MSNTTKSLNVFKIYLKIQLFQNQKINSNFAFNYKQLIQQ